MLDNDDELYHEVTMILNNFKIPASMAGFDFLRSAVLECFKHKELCDGNTTLLYKHLAQILETNVPHIERNIRNAIEKAFSLDGLLAINEYCETVVYQNTFKFTNSEFIYSIVEIIRIRMMKKNLARQYCSQVETQEEVVSE